jgi:hypothetical protein
MSPSWNTPETAVVAIDDLLALLMSGYTVELVPLDLIGPDRAVLRLTRQDGDATDQREVRIATMRGLAGGISELRRQALGHDGEPAGQLDGRTTPADAGLPLGLMAAIFGVSDPSGPNRLGDDSAPRSVRPTDPAAMAAAIASALRPAWVGSVIPDRDDESGPDPGDAPEDSSEVAPGVR